MSLSINHKFTECQPNLYARILELVLMFIPLPALKSRKSLSMLSCHLEFAFNGSVFMSPGKRHSVSCRVTHIIHRMEWRLEPWRLEFVRAILENQNHFSNLMMQKSSQKLRHLSSLSPRQQWAKSKGHRGRGRRFDSHRVLGFFSYFILSTVMCPYTGPSRRCIITVFPI